MVSIDSAWRPRITIATSSRVIVVIVISVPVNLLDFLLRSVEFSVEEFSGPKRNEPPFRYIRVKFRDETRVLSRALSSLYRHALFDVAYMLPVHAHTMTAGVDFNGY